MSAAIYVNAIKRVRVLSIDVTYNLGPMLRAAGMDWADFTALETAALKEKLGTTIDKLQSDPDGYRRYNPANGWGSYEVLVNALIEILKALTDPHHIDPKVETWL